MSLKKFIADRTFYRYVLALAVPLMLQQLINASVNLVDNLMVGQLGDASLAGVAAVNRLYMIALFALFGFMSASAVFIAQFYGAKDEDHLKQSFRFGLLICLAIASIFFLVSAIFPEACIGFFTSDQVIIRQGVEYIKYISWATLPLAICIVFSDAIRAVGDVKTPMFAAIIAVLCNCLFNYILIFGHFGLPKMGVAGAGLATLIARMIELLILGFWVWNNDYPFKTKISNLFNIKGYLAKNVFIKGLPLTSNEILWSFGMATLFKFYATRGAEVMSGYAIAGTVADLFFTLFGGMAAATTIIISQKLGANKLAQARSDGFHLLGFSVGVAFCLGIIMFGTSFIVPTWYKVTPMAMATAQNIIRIQAMLFWVYMTSAQSYFILRAGGDTKAVLLMDACYMWFVNIPIVAAIAYLTNFGIIYLYIFGQITDLVKMFIAYNLVKKGRWVRNLTQVKGVT